MKWAWGVAVWLALTPVASAAPPQKRALILYDGTSIQHREGLIDAMHIANLLGHFGYTGTRLAVEDYRAGGMAGYDAVFVAAGAESAPLPDAMIRDARARQTTIVWIGNQLDRLLDQPEAARRGLRIDGYLRESRFRRVKYKETLLGKGTGDLARLTVLDPRAVVHAAAVDPDGRELPYIIQAGAFWAVADVPFAYVDEQDRYLAFCDILHDMLGVPHATDRRALMRLEDVTPEDDPGLVRRAVRAFTSEGIPFQIGIVPIFRDPSSGREVTLSDRPALVAALHDAVHDGGTIVLHGATHQYHGVTPDDFEFWDAEENRPRADDSAQLVRDKLATAIDECFRNDVFPVAWEMPHYTASMLDYDEVAKVFSTIYERPLTIELQGTQQFFPYPTVDVRGTQVVPENLGYLPGANPDPAVLVGNARALLVVRDAVASGYVHDFLDPRAFGDVIRGVTALGYRYISLRDFPARVAAGSRLVLTSGAQGTVTLNDEYLDEFVVGSDGSIAHERFSSSRRSGEAAPTLRPGPGEILVARGRVEPPPAPVGPVGWAQGLGRRAWNRIRLHSPLPLSPSLPLTVALLWDPAASADASNDQESFRQAFGAYGVPTRLLAHGDLRQLTSSRDVLVAPVASARALTGDEVSAVAAFVRGGGALITDGRSKLSEALGIAYTGQIATAGNIRDTVTPETRVRWRPLAAIEAFRLPRGAVSLDVDRGTGTPVTASVPAGSGHVLYLAAQFDPYTPDGTSRYPFLVDHAFETFGRVRLARRAGIELYFDPGLRPGVDIERLAPAWRRLGVRIIYAAAWEFDPNYTYDYERLLRVAHANGLLVYAWFEFPQVSRAFWLHHPEWREVPAAGQAYPSWRLAMNLENPACRAAVLQFLNDLVGRWHWDGVNLAELNFDGVANGDDPARSVPMNADVRAAFQAAHGFDPAGLFDRSSRHWWKRDSRGWTTWLAYRRGLVEGWHRDFLAALRPWAEGGREVIVTAIDSLERPQVGADSGVDSTAIVRLLHDYDFTLQVEDPAVAWTGSPRRYERLAARYRALLPPDRRFMFDINVIPDRRIEATHLPLAAATGTELLGAVKAARSAGPRVALYGDSTVRPADLESIASAFADRARVSSEGLSWAIDTPEPIELAVPAGLHDFYLEGAQWPYWRPGFVLVPAGRHVVSTYRPWLRLFDLSGFRPQMLLLNGSLENADAPRGRLRFEYDSDSRALALLDRKPNAAVLDGQIALDVGSAQDRSAALLLPKGHHTVEVSGSNRGLVILDLVSVISSSLIVAFGTAASLTLLLVYGGIRIRRLIHIRGH